MMIKEGPNPKSMKRLERTTQWHLKNNEANFGPFNMSINQIHDIIFKIGIKILKFINFSFEL